MICQITGYEKMLCSSGLVYSNLKQTVIPTKLVNLWSDIIIKSSHSFIKLSKPPPVFHSNVERGDGSNDVTNNPVISLMC